VAQVPAGQGNLDASHDDQPAEDRSGNDLNVADKTEDATPQIARQRSPEPETDRAPYFDLAQRAAGALGQMSMLVLPAAAREREAAPPPPRDESPAARSAGWIDDFERELKPVGRSLGNAFDFLWRAGESADG
jgi:hypothetical protein